MCPEIQTYMHVKIREIIIKIYMENTKIIYTNNYFGEIECYHHEYIA